MAGLVRIENNTQLDARQTAESAAMDRQNDPLIQGLAGHLRRLWEPAKRAKLPIETKMFKALRQRNGEYEQTTANAIAKQGGSAVYMMVTETKCRGAESWLRDILLEDGKIPFQVSPSPRPDINPEDAQRITESFGNKVMSQMQSGQPQDPEAQAEMKELAEQEVRNEIMEEAQETADAMQTLIEDQFAEGGMIEGFNAFISDLVTYPNAFLKGPVVRKKRKMKWVQGPDGKYAPDVSEDLVPTYMRVDPYRLYPEPGVTNINEGFVFEHHRLSRPELAALKGVPGYDDDAISKVLEDMPYSSTGTWLNPNEQTKATLEQKYNIWDRPTATVDALEFTGKVPGSKLLEWGLTAEEVPDPDKEYDCNAWLIDRWVIKATMNYDPLGRNAYYTSSFVKRPGALWGTGIPELIDDIQNMCNAAARALVNNMGLASGPMVEVNVDRLPADEEITTLTPWRVFQVTNDPMGSGQPAVRFNQPQSNANELMQVYTHFTKLADDQSGIPAYVYGDMNVGGAGRTASGLSMLMGSAGKGIRQVIMHLDMDVVGPAVEAQYDWNMRYVDDDSVKGDSQTCPKGAIQLATKEQLNVRRVEFLQATANPMDSQIVGIPGRAAILREVAKGLNMPVDDIIPSKEKLEIMQAEQEAQKKQEQEQQMQAQQQQAAQANAPRSITIQKGAPGQPAPAPTFPGGAPKGGKDANTVSSSISGH
jgi:hypothetical protein